MEHSDAPAPRNDVDATVPTNDPGWGPVLRGLFLHSLTFGFKQPSEQQHGGLIVMRFLFSALLMAALLIGFVLAFVVDEIGTPEPAISALVVALGLIALAVAAKLQQRPLGGPESSAADVAGAYRTTFFLCFAIVEMPLLIGFVLTFVRDSGMWPYLVSLPAYLVGMMWIAPTRSNLERHQRRLQEQGSNIQLATAIDQGPIIPDAGDA